MRITIRAAFAAAILSAGAVVPLLPATAQVRIDNSDPGRFVDTLADAGLGALRTGSRTAARSQFRTLLAQHFAVDQIGDRLIRAHVARITPQQRAAYKAAFPSFLINTYADRLQQYARADVRIVRVVPAGNSAQVLTQVVQPGGASPINATWTVERTGGAWKVSNLTVAGINLGITQANDFNSVIQRQGFDGLVKLMQSRAG
ncbi:MlaC/ttg2D family ABC transporter substrate-binding protein [Sphingomonas montana]|uniref:MlaC/ttg2D family ABC transporter substrate-binding protein n=1 Tax=Sphingomonas montana TaxID=1843236 RepID=UPI00096D1532|nr:ABC transporter substrate-binding protein [Sphingomonas montana]